MLFAQDNGFVPGHGDPWLSQSHRNYGEGNASVRVSEMLACICKNVLWGGLLWVRLKIREWFKEVDENLMVGYRIFVRPTVQWRIADAKKKVYCHRKYITAVRMIR